ncbi:SURF1 family-domain-containing protein, partial [Lipomyces japonicus]|uniref:SURF1 family-domain-containing protein n=1 Tax=Lipomyces japonicus TaxID=56871 RepID=UPI0034CF689A
RTININTSIDWDTIKVEDKRKTFRYKSMMSLMVLMPVISFSLCVWQIKRLKWKTDLVAEYENRLILPPLILPPRLNPEAAANLQYRKVMAKGKFRYDEEILVGPRMYEGEKGYAVITPFERENGTKILVNRGWIKESMADQSKRKLEAMPQGNVVIEGLIKLPAKKNYFTPENRPDKNEYYYVDVAEFARTTGSQPVVIEELFNYLNDESYVSWELIADTGEPIGRLPKIDLRNNHFQYIATWFGVGVASTIMLVLMLRLPKSDQARKLRHLKVYS